MKKIMLIVFLLSGATVLVASVWDMPAWLHLVAKPMIVASLAMYYVSGTDRESRSRVLMAALFFSWLGDVLLMFEDQATYYFMLGLGAFLAAHLFYIFAYKQSRHDESANALLGVQRVRLAFPVILAGSGLVIVLYPVLGDLKFPVVIYACAIVVMVLTALFRFGRTTPVSFWMVFGGAVLFMTSDAILAINKFLSPVAFAGWWIMITYVTAQFFIVEGLMRHDRS